MHVCLMHNALLTNDVLLVVMLVVVVTECLHPNNITNASHYISMHFYHVLQTIIKYYQGECHELCILWYENF